jgi:hypothetical protein
MSKYPFINEFSGELRAGSFYVALSAQAVGDSGERSGWIQGSFTAHEESGAWAISHHLSGLRVTACRTKEDAFDLLERRTAEHGDRFECRADFPNKAALADALK